MVFEFVAFVVDRSGNAKCATNSCNKNAVRFHTSVPSLEADCLALPSPSPSLLSTMADAAAELGRLIEASINVEDISEVQTCLHRHGLRSVADLQALEAAGA